MNQILGDENFTKFRRRVENENNARDRNFLRTRSIESFARLILPTDTEETSKLLYFGGKNAKLVHATRCRSSRAPVSVAFSRSFALLRSRFARRPDDSRTWVRKRASLHRRYDKRTRPLTPPTHPARTNSPPHLRSLSSTCLALSSSLNFECNLTTFVTDPRACVNR